jgi:hypothetical protein
MWKATDWDDTGRYRKLPADLRHIRVALCILAVVLLLATANWLLALPPAASTVTR